MGLWVYVAGKEARLKQAGLYLQMRNLPVAHQTPLCPHGLQSYLQN